MKRFTPVSTSLLTLATLTVLTVLGLAGCGGGSDNTAPARTYQSVDLPMDLALDALTSEQRTTFCSWIHDAANHAATDATQTELAPEVVQACLRSFSDFPVCTVGQYDACMKAFSNSTGDEVPKACQAIRDCPVFSPPPLDVAPPSRVCDGTMMPGALRWCDADGTAKDMNSGNVWLKNGGCVDFLGLPPSRGGLNDEDSFRWAARLSSGHCGLLDGSRAGNWALPSMDEINALTLGSEPVSQTTQRLFSNIVDLPGYATRTEYWELRREAWIPGTWMGFVFPANPSAAGKPVNWFASKERPYRLPVRQTLVATPIASGDSYSVAPSSALSPVAGTPYFTRSYLTPDPAVNGYTAAYVGLSGWDNAVRTPRIWFFDADTDPVNAGYFRIRYAASGGSVRYLAVIGNSIHPGANVIGWPDAGGDNRLWKPEFVEGGVMLKSKLSGLCMHIETNDGLFLRQATCDATNKAQVFVLTPRQDAPAQSRAVGTNPDALAEMPIDS